MVNKLSTEKRQRDELRLLPENYIHPAQAARQHPCLMSHTRVACLLDVTRMRVAVPLALWMNTRTRNTARKRVQHAMLHEKKSTRVHVMLRLQGRA